MAKTKYQPGGDILRLYAKSLKYRYVDVTPTLSKMRIVI